MKAASAANRAILVAVARALDGIDPRLTFVGGCATGLLVTSAQAQDIRPTRDVDVVAAITSLADYHRLEQTLRDIGFVHDRDGPTCRWAWRDITVDVMPSTAVLGFTNRWFPLALETACEVSLAADCTIRLIAAPVFVATKLEAFRDRGADDYTASADLEDVVTVVDGRAELLDEAAAFPDELRQYLAAECARLLALRSFRDSIAAHLSGDPASQARAAMVLERFNQLSQLR
ncbi:MAG: hypothetical protein SF182_25470 [Deltaproteobacteria bacterium]|nr:hypothetical protein [Deltaproteobacteria bacterium]